ncbi:MAG: hypothetical protein ACREEE_10015 [Dongiaceae bacterium]
MIVSAALFALVLGAFIFLVLPRGVVWQRAISVGLFAALIAVVYGGGIELLSQPKPIRLEWRHVPEAELVGATMVEGEAIYVWLRFDANPEPRAYALPWDVNAAQQLQEAMQEAEANGTGVRMKMPTGDSMDSGEARFWAKPQQPLPEKSHDANGPLIYQQPESPS